MVDFLKYSKIYFLISAIVIGAGILSVIFWGFRYSIDFVGGTNLSYQVNTQLDAQKEQTIKGIFKTDGAELESFKVTGQTVEARTKAIDEKKAEKIRQDIAKKLNTKVEALRVETVGPILGRETLIKTVTAAVIAIVGILLYMTFAFKGLDFALAAILAMIHDFVVLVGTYSIISHFFGAELDTLFVTAILTSMSFSVHDTIIIFDKIREYQKTEGIAHFDYAINRALSETLVRSINNSATILFMLLALVLLGGSTIKFFVVALLIGTVTGAYSSPFVATPLLYLFKKRQSKKR